MNEEMQDLRRKLSNKETSYIAKSNIPKREYDTLTRNQMFKQLKEKDAMIEDLVSQLKMSKGQVERTVYGKNQKEQELASKTQEMNSLKEDTEM